MAKDLDFVGDNEFHTVVVPVYLQSVNYAQLVGRTTSSLEICDYFVIMAVNHHSAHGVPRPNCNAAIVGSDLDSVYGLHQGHFDSVIRNYD